MIDSILHLPTPSGLCIAVVVSTISCITADDDLMDMTVLTLNDDSVVVVAEAYEDVLDMIVETWSDHH